MVKMYETEIHHIMSNGAKRDLAWQCQTQRARVRKDDKKIHTSTSQQARLFGVKKEERKGKTKNTRDKKRR